MAAEAVTATIAETPDHGWIEKLVVWTIVLFAGQANVFTRSLGSWDMVAAPILFLGVHLLLAWKAEVRFDRKYLYVIGGFTVYFAATTWKYHELHPRFWGIYVLFFSCVFIALRAMGMRFFNRFEDVLAKLTAIALILWAIQIVAPGPLRSVLSLFEYFKSTVTLGGVNGIIYSIQSSGGMFPRNCGFAWEPGGFASILVFGIFINLLRNELRWKRNARLALFLAALVTTQSTTGWTTAAILLAWFVSRQRTWPIWLAIAGPMAFFAMAHPMMGDKIREAMDKDERSAIVEAMGNAYEYERIYTPQRFASFQIALEDFRMNPLLGFGGHDNDSWVAREKIRVNLVTGLGDILRRFGLAGMAFFICMTWWSSTRFIALNYGAGWVLFGLVMSVGFSYAQIQQPLFMTFWMAGIFLSANQGREASRRTTPSRWSPVLQHAEVAR